MNLKKELKTIINILYITEDNKIKKCCKFTLEISKIFIIYILYKDATKKEV